MPRGKDSNRIVEPSPLAGEGSPQPALSPAGAGRVRGIRCRIYETTYLLTCPFLRHPGWKRDLCFRNQTRNLLCYQQQVALSAKNLLQRDHRCYTPSLADRCRSAPRETACGQLSDAKACCERQQSQFLAVPDFMHPVDFEGENRSHLPSLYHALACTSARQTRPRDRRPSQAY